MHFYAMSAGFQQITDLSAAVALTIPAGVKGAMIQAESKNVRWRADGTDPAADVGLMIFAGDPPSLFSDASGVGAEGLGALKFIEVEGSAKLNVQYIW